MKQVNILLSHIEKQKKVWRFCQYMLVKMQNSKNGRMKKKT